MRLPTSRQGKKAWVCSAGGRVCSAGLKKTEKDLITYVDKPSTKTQSQGREG